MNAVQLWTVTPHTKHSNEDRTCECDWNQGAMTIKKYCPETRQHWLDFVRNKEANLKCKHCSRHFMVCTYPLRKLPFAGNQQCKMTLSLFEKSSICQESTMQNNPLSHWENSYLLRINNVKWHSLTLRDLLFAENQQCKVTFSHSDQSAHC